MVGSEGGLNRSDNFLLAGALLSTNSYLLFSIRLPFKQTYQYLFWRQEKYEVQLKCSETLHIIIVVGVSVCYSLQWCFRRFPIFGMDDINKQ